MAKTRQETLNLALARRDAPAGPWIASRPKPPSTAYLAPIDGVIVASHADPGETVSPATSLVTIVNLTRLRVEAEVNEFDIPRITPESRRPLPPKATRARMARSGRADLSDRRAQANPPRESWPSGRYPRPDREDRLLEPNPLKLGQRVEVEIRGPDSRR